MSLWDSTKKQTAKIIEEAPRKLFWGLFALISFTGFLPPIRHWLLHPVEIYGVTIVAFGILIVGLGVFVWLLYRRVRAMELKAAEQKLLPGIKPTVTLPQYVPAVMRDDTLGIEWHIMKEPSGWILDSKLDSRGPEYWAKIIAGPFHTECKESFKPYSHEESAGQHLDGTCSHCHRVIFYWQPNYGWDEDGSEVELHRTLSETQFAVLRELQRMHRRDGAIPQMGTLKKLEYTEWMQAARESLPNSN
jgi:hypothetical protein